MTNYGDYGYYPDNYGNQQSGTEYPTYEQFKQDSAQYAAGAQQYAGEQQYDGYADANYAEEQYGEYEPSEDFDDVKTDFEPISPKKRGKANIVVVGVGGAGNNAVNNMLRAGLKSANFVAMNTDLQALNMAQVPPQCKIQLGVETTEGLGAGSDPEVGRRAAEESRDQIEAAFKGIDLLFITAGMGGGTGTGAAPVIAEIAKGMGILTVGVVTKPFAFEGQRRMQYAEEGIAKLKDFVDTLLVIPNQKLTELDRNVPLTTAFEIADDVLRQGIQSVSDVIANPQRINLDFADVRTVLQHSGLAHMGIGSGKGDNRVLEAVRGAVNSPLLEGNIEGATGIIINIIGGMDMKLSEVDEACAMVKQVVDQSANIIFGMDTRPDKQDIEITIIATGFDNKKTRSMGPTQIKPINVPDPRQAVNVPPQQPVYNMQRPTFEDYHAAASVVGDAQRQFVREESFDPAPAQAGSRMNVPPRPVPAFLRKIHPDDNNR